LEKEADPFPPVGSLTMGRKPRPPIPLIILSTGRDPFVISAALLSWGKLRGEPAIRQFDWSFGYLETHSASVPLSLGPGHAEAEEEKE
jgi:hypothetical protein